MGSFVGLIGGLAVSVFSKPLAVVIGLLVFGIQVWCIADKSRYPWSAPRTWHESSHCMSLTSDTSDAETDTATGI